MPKPKFVHQDLKLIEPSFGSKLTDLIIDLDYLRRKKLGGSTPALLFFQLKEIFHMLESIGSARIEGNNTTIAEYMETKIQRDATVPEKIREIENIENTMDFIEDYAKTYPINKLFISEMHKGIMEGLSPSIEGDQTPGKYRRTNVKIAGSSHLPPDYLKIDDYMDELFEFINDNHNSKYDLLKIAIAHHRFVWIHPFTNGNGRTVRLFTYALLVKSGFNVDVGRILNPTAIFCGDRNNYYHQLALADNGTEQGLLLWCEYVLEGLKNEIEKIDLLTDYKYLREEILHPSIQFSLEQHYITGTEAKVLKRSIEKEVIQAGDLRDIFPGKLSAEISRQIKKLITKRMLMPEKERGKKYVISFDNSYLLRGIIKALRDKGFISLKDES